MEKEGAEEDGREWKDGGKNPGFAFAPPHKIIFYLRHCLRCQ